MLRIRDYLLPTPSISRTWGYARNAEVAVTVTPPPPTETATARRERRAKEFRKLMAADGLTRAELARKLGVSRAWVTKVLQHT
jgi:DNA invertase Pin-like site-specific DNA recombinase